WSSGRKFKTAANVGHGATTTNTLIAGSAVRAFAQPTLAQANRLFQQRLPFGSPGHEGSGPWD
ncbi:MAG: hypothetical protein, partial [Olavius algarvensis Gamma 1 endosymbiont]